jgi:ribosomal-protein-alanine N-acetyltransferase
MPNAYASLATERLVLRPITLADSAAVQVELPRWDVVKYLTAGMPWPYPPDGARRMLRDVTLPAVRRGREWAWAIAVRTDPARLIGMMSLMTNRDDNRGYWLGLDWQRRGLMTEASAAIIDYWFDVLGFDVLRETKALANTASLRLSRRHGMRLVRIVEHDFVAGTLPAGIWELTADEWRARRAAGGAPA